VRVADVRFVEVEFPVPAASARMVIVLSDGLQLVLADPTDITLAAGLIENLRNLQKGGRK
jgi:hypothetical protein